MHGTIKQRIKHREDMFLRRLFGILAKMAKVDGKVDAWEAHAAEGAFARFPRAMARRKFCVSVFNSSKNGRTPLCSLAAEFEKEWAMPEDCLAVYELLWDIAHCVICAFRLDYRQTTSRSSIVGVVRHSVKLKKKRLVMRIGRQGSKVNAPATTDRTGEEVGTASATTAATAEDTTTGSI